MSEAIAKMEETKVHYNDENVVNEPPPYTSGLPTSSYGGPQSYTTSVTMVNPPIGVVGTQVGVVGTQVGVVGMSPGTVPVLIQQQISPKPTRLTCKTCNSDIITRVESKPTWKTHFFAGALCLVGCWCCVCIPYCIDSCSNKDHYCPTCNAYIGSYIT